MQTRRDFLKAVSLLAGACAVLRTRTVAAAIAGTSGQPVGPGVMEGHFLPPDWWSVRPLEIQEVVGEDGFGCALVRFSGLDLFHHSYVRPPADLKIGDRDAGLIPISLAEMIERTRLPADLAWQVKDMGLDSWYCQLPEVECAETMVYEVTRTYRGYPRLG